MFSLFAQSRAGANLSPGQRALLKLIQGFVIAGIVAAWPVISQALAQQTIDWPQLLRNAGYAFAVAFFMAIYKYCSAQGDPPLQPLANAALDVATAIEQHADIPYPNPLPFNAPTPPAPAEVGLAPAPVPPTTPQLDSSPNA